MAHIRKELGFRNVCLLCGGSCGPEVLDCFDLFGDVGRRSAVAFEVSVPVEHGIAAYLPVLAPVVSVYVAVFVATERLVPLQDFPVSIKLGIIVIE